MKILEYVLNGRTLDYLIVNHMEPDHCAVIGDVVRRYPDVKLVCNAKTVPMLKQFFNFPVEDRTVIVKEMDTLCTGKTYLCLRDGTDGTLAGSYGFL